MVGYPLKNTLTENGTAACGICKTEDGFLVDIKEDTAISTENDYDGSTIVSMNFWGLKPDIFPYIEKGFSEFKTTNNIKKDEYFYQLL